ncbi:type II toxin-antitoxin system RelE/ParE family toxin [Halomonas sp.]|uniref:type II toxin-antitoxin system RelE/ParE family toxin n=1 Tax=Halomonas sp. TaxID=1486246 RepID=UPI0025C00A9A|nr:type II toxin-antitoxin system RelE/ParE family toxin [Halomonas sp.]
MENKYRVIIVPIAEEDLDDIFYYIALELNNKSAAEKLIDQISNKILRLQDFPFSCSLVEDPYLKDKGYRKLIVDNYTVFYIVNEADKQAVVMRVLYSRKKYEGLL